MFFLYSTLPTTPKKTPVKFGGRIFFCKVARCFVRDNNYGCLLEVDGGVNIDNAQALREAGANILVAGTAIYKSTDVWASTALLKGE